MCGRVSVSVCGPDGVPCVAGADSQGYIPLRFWRDQLVDIVSPLSDNR